MPHSKTPEHTHPQLRLSCTVHGDQALAAIIGGAFERHLVLTCGCAFRLIGPSIVPIFAASMPEYAPGPRQKRTHA